MVSNAQELNKRLILFSRQIVKMMAAMSNGEPIRDLRISGDYRHGGPQGMMADYQVNEIMAGFYGEYLS